MTTEVSTEYCEITVHSDVIRYIIRRKARTGKIGDNEDRNKPTKCTINSGLIYY